MEQSQPDRTGFIVPFRVCKLQRILFARNFLMVAISRQKREMPSASGEDASRCESSRHVHGCKDVAPRRTEIEQEEIPIAPGRRGQSNRVRASFCECPMTLSVRQDRKDDAVTKQIGDMQLHLALICCRGRIQSKAVSSAYVIRRLCRIVVRTTKIAVTERKIRRRRLSAVCYPVDCTKSYQSPVEGELLVNGLRLGPRNRSRSNPKMF